MVLAPEQSWKLVLAIVLCVAIVLSARARAPRRAVPHGELRNLVEQRGDVDGLSALVLLAAREGQPRRLDAGRVDGGGRVRSVQAGGIDLPLDGQRSGSYL